MARTVTIVVDREFGDRLEPLAFRNPIWIVESDPNRYAASMASHKAVDWPQISVTVFRFSEEPTSDEWLSLLRQLDIGQRRQFDTVIVIGTSITEAMLTAFEEAGFEKLEETAEGVRASRRPEISSR
jgi:hypothetical protein